MLLTLMLPLIAFTCVDEYEPVVLEQEGDLPFGGGGGGDCFSLEYEGPTNNPQFDSQCQLAQVYACTGNQDGVTVACSLLDDFDYSCPYCN